MLNISSAVRLQSSIAAPTAMSKRDAATLVADQDLHSQIDPLDGSLGPFLASCALILIVIVTVTSVFWGVHRRTRLHVSSQPALGLPTADSHFSLFSANPSVKLPPSRLHIRSPIQRLRLLRGPSNDSGSTIPLWISPPKTATPGLVVPEIVLSHPSPLSRSPTSPSLTTFAPPNTVSAGSLQVPGARRPAKRPPKPTSLIQLISSPRSSQHQPRPQHQSKPLAPRQPPTPHAKTRSPTKKGSPAKSPRKARKSATLGKENQPLQMQVKANRTRNIFGARYLFHYYLFLRTADRDEWVQGRYLVSDFVVSHVC